jgi:hypothetical protein
MSLTVDFKIFHIMGIWKKYSHKVVMSTVTVLSRNGNSSSKFHTFIEMEPSFLFPLFFFLFHSYIFQCAFSKLTGLCVEGGKRESENFTGLEAALARVFCDTLA